jgi:hypothetical protein
MSLYASFPQSGDKAFVEGSDAHAFNLQAILDAYPFHAEAFRAAAEQLIDSRLEDPPNPFRDDLFFPIAYLYRHCLEIRLKGIVTIGQQLGTCNSKQASVALKVHDLHKLWILAKEVIIHRWSEGDEVRATEAVIKEFHQADPTSQTFRYSTDTKGKPHSHPTIPTSLNARTLRDTMN